MSVSCRVQCYFVPVFLSEIINFCNLCLCVVFDGDEVVLDIGEKFFLLDDLGFEGAEEVPDLRVLLLIDLGDGLEGVRLVFPEHLALTAGRLIAVHAEVVQVDPMHFALLSLLLMLNQPEDQSCELVEKA